MDYEQTDKDALASLEARQITNLAYEARDLDEVGEAMIDLADELWDMGHDGPALLTLAAARATQKAAHRIGEIDG